MTVTALKARLPALPTLNVNAIKIALIIRLRRIGENVSLWAMTLPARPIILGLIGILIAANFIRAALPFALSFIPYTPLLETLFGALALVDNFSIVILFAALWLTKFNSTSELKTDLVYLVLGILLKQFAWHAGTLLGAGLLNDFSNLAPYLNWVWIWGCIYALAIAVVWDKGSRYVRSSSSPVRNKSSKK